eukprot:TRINITY_DN32452_c0_g1_i1.p1 TRINITY_DN32452_c0_g1~~TRINITY_DN32452_c0_g1_i1.p1  ORF type:complete len:262 (-),score=10.51 TRINITY_DN32452_c0_g1_i1:100-885(-)
MWRHFRRFFSSPNPLGLSTSKVSGLASRDLVTLRLSGDVDTRRSVYVSERVATLDALGWKGKETALEVDADILEALKGKPEQLTYAAVDDFLKQVGIKARNIHRGFPLSHSSYTAQPDFVIMRPLTHHIVCGILEGKVSKKKERIYPEILMQSLLAMLHNRELGIKRIEESQRLYFDTILNMGERFNAIRTSVTEEYLDAFQLAKKLPHEALFMRRFPNDGDDFMGVHIETYPTTVGRMFNHIAELYHDDSELPSSFPRRS